jgi:hypothetical protein
MMVNHDNGMNTNSTESLLHETFEWLAKDSISYGYGGTVWRVKKRSEVPFKATK